MKNIKISEGLKKAYLEGRRKYQFTDEIRQQMSLSRLKGLKEGRIIIWNKGKKTGFIPKSAFKKEQIPWNKGTKGICKAWNKGKPHSEETKKKLSNSQKIRFTREPPWNKGLTKETDSRLNYVRPTVFKNGTLVNVGRKQSIESIQKRTETRRKNGWNRNPERRSKIMCEFMKKNNPMSNPVFKQRAIERGLAGSQKRPTNLEKKFIDIINKHNLPYRYCGNGEVIIGYKNPDFVNVNGEKICVETADKNQKEYHTKSRWQDWERERIEHFGKWGWKCVVVWADEIEKFDPKELKSGHFNN